MCVLEVHRCTDGLIEVNPRHVRFYEQMLGFTRAAEERIDESVRAPAVLMRLDLRHCAREIERLAGGVRSERKERSFYPYFFPRPVADEVVGRLRGWVRMRTPAVRVRVTSASVASSLAT